MYGMHLNPLDSSNYLVHRFPVPPFSNQQKHEGRECVTVDEVIKFWCRHKVADDVIALRAQLHQILAGKIQNPRKKEWSHGEKVVLEAIVALVTSKTPDEGASGGGGPTGCEVPMSVCDLEDGEDDPDEEGGWF